MSKRKTAMQNEIGSSVGQTKTNLANSEREIEREAENRVDLQLRQRTSQHLGRSPKNASSSLPFLALES